MHCNETLWYYVQYTIGMEKKEFLGISRTDWRIIGISLSILSLGLAIAWGGFILLS